MGEAAPQGEDGEFFDPADAETVATIKELIETRVRPAVAGDGGDIVFRGFQGRRRLSDDEGRLLRLSVILGDPKESESKICCAISFRRFAAFSRLELSGGTVALGFSLLLLVKPS